MPAPITYRIYRIVSSVVVGSVFPRVCTLDVLFVLAAVSVLPSHGRPELNYNFCDDLGQY